MRQNNEQLNWHCKHVLGHHSSQNNRYKKRVLQK
jgi:hypothetical protein